MDQWLQSLEALFSNFAFIFDLSDFENGVCDDIETNSKDYFSTVDRISELIYVSMDRSRWDKINYIGFKVIQGQGQGHGALYPQHTPHYPQVTKFDFCY